MFYSRRFPLVDATGSGMLTQKLPQTTHVGRRFLTN